MKNYNKQRQLVLCCMGLTDPNNLANQKINNNNNNNNNSNNNNNNKNYNNNNNNKNNNKKPPETRKYWVDVQRGIV